MKKSKNKKTNITILPDDHKEDTYSPNLIEKRLDREDYSHGWKNKVIHRIKMPKNWMKPVGSPSIRYSGRQMYQWSGVTTSLRFKGRLFLSWYLRQGKTNRWKMTLAARLDKDSSADD